MDIEESLQDLGLTKNETKVYLALLSLGRSSIIDITHESGVKRSTVYDVLELLREKSLVLRIPHAKKQVYMAKDPREFIGEVEKRAETARTLLPQLLAQTQLDTKPNILYFDGIGGAVEAFSYLRKQGTTNQVLGFYGHSPEGLPKPYDRALLREYKRLGEDGIHIRALLPDHPSATRFLEFSEQHDFGWEGKVVPLEEYPAFSSFEIYDKAIRILPLVDWDQNIVIEHKHIADTQRYVFEMLWNRLP